MVLHDKSNKINQGLAQSAPTKNEHIQELNQPTPEMHSSKQVRS